MDGGPVFVGEEYSVCGWGYSVCEWGVQCLWVGGTSFPSGKIFNNQLTNY